MNNSRVGENRGDMGNFFLHCGTRIEPAPFQSPMTRKKIADGNAVGYPLQRRGGKVESYASPFNILLSTV